MLKKHPLLSVILAIVVMFFTIYFFIFGLATILDDDIGDSKELNNSFFTSKMTRSMPWCQVAVNLS